ncbi:hypothetical protein [Archangium sp.]|uniref:hypothetical protein n=1 Tax=Archangium sp. TaxID=1872627 RepID=UPI003899FC65
MRQVRRRKITRTTPQPNGPKKPIGTPTSGPILPPVTDALDALARVQALAKQGVFLIRSDKPDTLSIPVPLDQFRKAKILADQNRRTLGRALEVGEGAKSISVALVPRPVVQSLTEHLEPLGRLVGKFSVETLGGKWMPSDWAEAFETTWLQQSEGFSLQKYRLEIDQHLNNLPRELTGKKLRRELGELVYIRKPSEWDMEAAARLLGWEEDREVPVKLGPALRKQIIDAILKHVRNTVDRRLNADYVHAQLSALGLLPYMRPTGNDMGTKEAILFLADWVQAAAEPRLKSADREISHAPNRSHVTQILAKKLNVDIVAPEQAFAESVRWQRAVIDENDAEPLDQVLVHVWKKFHDWFGFDATTAPWQDLVPLASTRKDWSQEKAA